MASRAWYGLTTGLDDKVVYDDQRVQLAYDRINAKKRPSLFPEVENWRKKMETRARLIQEDIENPRAVVPDFYRTLAGRTASQTKHKGGTFALGPARRRTGPSPYDDPGIDLTVLPSPLPKGGKIPMHRPPNEEERHIIRSASMPGPAAYDVVSGVWTKLKPGPKMISNISVPRLTSLSLTQEAAIPADSNLTFDSAVRPTLLGGYISGKLEADSGLFTTPGANQYNQTVPQQLQERVKGGLIALPVDEPIPLGPAPHDYQHPLSDRTKGLSHGLINPANQLNSSSSSSSSSSGGAVDGQNWWERGRGPGKYTINQTTLLPAPKLISIHPYPMAAENAYHRARARGVELKTWQPGPSDYTVQDSVPDIQGVGFGRLGEKRSFGLSEGGRKEDVPYLNPPMPGVTNVHEGPGNRIGFSLGGRTVLGVELEQIRRASEPSAQTYDALGGESKLYETAPSFTMRAKPYVDEDGGGALSGPGPMTYEPSSTSTGTMGAWRRSVRGSHYSLQYSTRAAGVHLPLPDQRPSDVPGPGEYKILDPVVPTALLGRELDPNADLKALFPKREKFSVPGPGTFNPTVERYGSGSSIGGRMKKYNAAKRSAIIKRARVKQMHARRSSAATWNG